MCFLFENRWAAGHKALFEKFQQNLWRTWPASFRSSRHTANKSRLVPDKFMFDFQLEKSKPRIAIKFSINPFSAVKLENYLGLIFHVLFLFSVIASCIKIDECAKIFRQMCFIAAKLGQNRKLLINAQLGKHSGRRLVRFTALRAHSLIASSHIGLNKLAYMGPFNATIVFMQ